MGVRTAQLGDYLFQCDVCAMVRYYSQHRKTWDGLLTCDECWDPKHPQLRLKKVKDDTSVPEARPRVYPHDHEFEPYVPPTQGQ